MHAEEQKHLGKGCDGERRAPFVSSGGFGGSGVWAPRVRCLREAPGGRVSFLPPAFKGEPPAAWFHQIL